MWQQEACIADSSVAEGVPQAVVAQDPRNGLARSVSETCGMCSEWSPGAHQSVGTGLLVKMKYTKCVLSSNSDSQAAACTKTCQSSECSLS